MTCPISLNDGMVLRQFYTLENSAWKEAKEKEISYESMSTATGFHRQTVKSADSRFQKIP